MFARICERISDCNEKGKMKGSVSVNEREKKVWMLAHRMSLNSKDNPNVLQICSIKGKTSLIIGCCAASLY